jgi:hypothetical protein
LDNVVDKFPQEEVYNELLQAYMGIHGGRGPQVLEYKIESLTKKGLSRIEAISKLANKEKFSGREKAISKFAEKVKLEVEDFFLFILIIVFALTLFSGYLAVNINPQFFILMFYGLFFSFIIAVIGYLMHLPQKRRIRMLLKEEKWSPQDPLKIKDFINLKAWAKLAVKYGSETSLVLCFMFFCGLTILIQVSVNIIGITVELQYLVFYMLLFPLFATYYVRDWLKTVLVSMILCYIINTFPKDEDELAEELCNIIIKLFIVTLTPIIRELCL